MKNARYIVFGLLISMALSMSARIFVQGEEIYVNAKQSDAIGDWSKDGAKLYLYFFENTNYEWVQLTKADGDIYKATFASAHTYSKVIVVRGTAADWGSKWNQSPDIDIPNDWNCIDNFNDASHRWKMYTPAVGKISSYSSQLTAENISVCPESAGNPFSLKAKLNSTKTDYDYSTIHGHGWFYSTNGTTWNSIDAYAGQVRDGERNIDTLINLPSPIATSGIYYYLYSSQPSGRRLIHIRPDADKCALDCSITSFETAISAVNADNNTFTLDGMVAFGEPNGKLIVECQGKSVTIDAPKSPQSFSLTGVPAATIDGIEYTATAHFTGQSSCTSSITIQVPNAKQAMDVIHRDTLTGAILALVPQDADPANDYVWIVDGVEYKKEDGQPQTFTVDAFTTDGEKTYIYKEFYPISGTMDDMMSNGNYEAATGYGTYGAVSPMSDYNFWGYLPETATTPMNFYKNTPAGINPSGLNSNGFAVVCDANHFAPSYAKVQARQGNNFALFDAATGTAGGNMKAWYATTAANPNLKLKKGTTYVLSFWAANVNNYGEMDNAARFKFRIEYNGHTWESRVLDLGSAEFRNNIWHQCSQTFYADEDCDNVTISVVNLNTNTLNIGNDFALDDIQFHAISSVSRVVKSQQQFVVKAHEPKVDAFTATVQPVDCDGTNYTIAMHVAYQNPNGQLIIKDKTTGTEYPYDLPAVAYDTPATLDKNIVITTNEPTHEWEAYFANWTTAKQTATTVIPGFPAIEAKNFVLSDPACADLTTTLTFDLDYTYQQGTLTFWVDGLAAQTATYSVANKSQQTLTGLTFGGIPADGKNNHVLHVSFDGAHSCVETYNLPAVPFSPVITSVTVTSVPTTVLCPDTEYPVTVKIVTPYDATGRNIRLTYDDNGINDTTVVATGTTTTATLPLHTIGGAAQTITAAYAATPTCTAVSANFTPPTRTSCEKLDTTICEGQTVTWMGQTYSGHVGLTDTITNPTNVYDTLILTVNALPRITIGTVSMICDDANEIRIPFTLTAGNPDTYDVTIDGNHFAGAVDGTDIVFTPTTITPGDYTATLTVSESASECETVSGFSFTVALSGQMYSKWTDVLFINNSAGTYIAYQWYADGVLIPGETQQRLYDPNGLSGTASAYYCRLTTTDGQTLYTCPLTFDETPRSANNTSTTPTQIIRKYRVTPHVYIIQMQMDDTIITKKILTPYE